MKRSRKGFTLIELIVVIFIIILVFTFISKMAWYLAFGPIIRNIIPLVIGGFVGYWIGET